MRRKTEGVRILVQDILQTFPRTYGEDVIEEVFLAVEGNHDWHRRYDELCAALSKWVVNQWIGKYTSKITGLQALREVDTTRSGLTKSYSKLGS